MKMILVHYMYGYKSQGIYYSCLRLEIKQKTPKEIVPHGQKNYRKRIKFRKKVKWAQAEINVSDTSNDSVN